MFIENNTKARASDMKYMTERGGRIVATIIINKLTTESPEEKIASSCPSIKQTQTLITLNSKLYKI